MKNALKIKPAKLSDQIVGQLEQMLLEGSFAPGQKLPTERELADLGIAPTPIDAVLPEYLWRYRPAGQYAAIKESAKNLRKA